MADPMTNQTTDPTTAPRHHRRWLVAAVVALVAVASACQLQQVTPQGEGPLRYRDEIFTQVAKTADVVYGSAPSQSGVTTTLKVDVYQPTGDTVSARPAIIWIHGGSFTSGSKTSAEIVDEANTFARKGFVTFSISYRLSANGCRTVNAECLESITDAREDAQAAVRFLRKNAATYGVDVGRLAIAGTSAGAITALEVAYGPETIGNSGNPGFASNVNAAVSLSGSRVLTTPEPGEAAALLFHGTADPLVPYAWATTTLDLATGAGLDAFLTTWEGDGHVPYAAHRTQIIDETTNFLWWELNLANANL